MEFIQFSWTEVEKIDNNLDGAKNVDYDERGFYHGK